MNAAKRLAREMKTLQVDYCIVGGNALNAHGYDRATTDVDVLVTQAGLDKFKKSLIGKGYVPRFHGASKSFKDTINSVPVDFVTTGEFPGDGLPKEVAFPDPKDVSFTAKEGEEDLNYISLFALINLKLASALSEPSRLKDKVDVMELIERCSLDEKFACQLAPSVRSEFLQLVAQVSKKRPPE